MSQNNITHQSPSYSHYELEVFKYFSSINVETLCHVATKVDTKSSICHLFFCPLCGERPNYYQSYNGTSNLSPYVHFHCYSCPYQWMLCRLCCHKSQPTLLSKRDQHRNII